MRNSLPWDDFLGELEAKTQALGLQPGEEIFYRGHADGAWKLQPTLLRKTSDPNQGESARSRLVLRVSS